MSTPIVPDLTSLSSAAVDSQKEAAPNKPSGALDRVNTVLTKLFSTLSVIGYVFTYIKAIRFTSMLSKITTHSAFLTANIYLGRATTVLSTVFNIKNLYKQHAMISRFHQDVKANKLFKVSKEEIKTCVSEHFFKKNIENLSEESNEITIEKSLEVELQAHLGKIKLMHLLGVLSSFLAIGSIVAGSVACPVVPLALTAVSLLFFICKYIYENGVLNKKDEAQTISLFQCLPEFIRNYAEGFSLLTLCNSRIEEFKNKKPVSSEHVDPAKEDFFEKRVEDFLGQEHIQQQCARDDTLDLEAVKKSLRYKIIIGSLNLLTGMLVGAVLELGTLYFPGIEVVMLSILLSGLTLFAIGKFIQMVVCSFKENDNQKPLVSPKTSPPNGEGITFSDLF